MAKGERIAVWVLVGLLVLTQVIALPLLFGEIAALRWQLEIATGARPVPEGGDGGFGSPPALPTPPANIGQAESWGSTLQVRATAIEVISSTATVTVTVQGSGAADPLLDLPVLICDGQAYPVDGPSLEAARLAYLGLISQGRATAGLLFYGGPDLTQPCVLLLNPDQPASSVVAPRIEVPVPQLAPMTDPEITEE